MSVSFHTRYVKAHNFYWWLSNNRKWYNKKTVATIYLYCCDTVKCPKLISERVFEKLKKLASLEEHVFKCVEFEKLGRLESGRRRRRPESILESIKKVKELIIILQYLDEQVILWRKAMMTVYSHQYQVSKVQHYLTGAIKVIQHHLDSGSAREAFRYLLPGMKNIAHLHKLHEKYKKKILTNDLYQSHKDRKKMTPLLNSIRHKYPSWFNKLKRELKKKHKSDPAKLKLCLTRSRKIAACYRYGGKHIMHNFFNTEGKLAKTITIVTKTDLTYISLHDRWPVIDFLLDDLKHWYKFNKKARTRARKMIKNLARNNRFKQNMQVLRALIRRDNIF